MRSTTILALTAKHSVKLAPSDTIQSDRGALGERGGAKPGRHCPVGGDLVGGDGWARQGLQGGQEKTHWDLGRVHLLTL